jgi:hypothetical protein
MQNMSNQNKATSKERVASVYMDKRGVPTAEWTLTSHTLDDPVYITLPPTTALPIVFVPGIMGSNLRLRDKKTPVWRIDDAAKLAGYWIGKNAAKRQSLLNPNATEVDPDGEVPTYVPTIGQAEQIRKRGWGTVSKASYQEFLLWLELKLNHFGNVHRSFDEVTGPCRADWKPDTFFKELGEAETRKCAKWRYPVYAVGYNWLQSNKDSAKHLKKEIHRIIAENNGPYSSCEQVIIVTHSMGGLVGRACSEIEGMREYILGILHGVMPATGAAVAYRRCKTGMNDEDRIVAQVIGDSGQKISAVFANAPGALQLLPNQEYPTSWLKIVHNTAGRKELLHALPKTDPYEEIYKVKDKWWGLMQESWINPANSRESNWSHYVKNIEKAKEFHHELAGKYHSNTYVFYGDAKENNSFTNIFWELSKGGVFQHTQISPHDIANLGPTQVLDDGQGRIYVNPKEMYLFADKEWMASCLQNDAKGDGTVPVCSGSAPREKDANSVQQQFSLKDISHEGAYKPDHSRAVTLYAIGKITQQAKVFA